MSEKLPSSARYLLEFIRRRSQLLISISSDASLAPTRIEETLNRISTYIEDHTQKLARNTKWWALLWSLLSSIALEVKTAALSRFDLRVIETLCSLMLDEPATCAPHASAVSHSRTHSAPSSGH